jgi:hypothetical protein
MLNGQEFSDHGHNFFPRKSIHEKGCANRLPRKALEDNHKDPAWLSSIEAEEETSMAKRVEPLWEFLYPYLAKFFSPRTRSSPAINL